MSMSTTVEVPSVNTTTMSPELIAARESQLSFIRNKIFVLQLFLLLGYGIMCFLCTLLIGYMRYNRHVAFRGDANAARKIILPAFEPLLWILFGATGLYTGFFCLAIGINMYTTSISKLATECFYSGRQFVFVVVIVFMLQKSVSIPALQRTIAVTFLLSSYTIPLVWYMVEYGNDKDFYWVLTTARALLLVLYTYVFIRPPGRASKRALREYCVFAYVYYGLLFTYNEMFERGNADAGFNLTYTNLLWGSMCPLVIWRVLKADTEYWRGMGQRACALQSLFRQKNRIDERISSQGLHVLIEMHRKYIIDFAYLELKERIGVGASAVVFRGVLHSKTPIAAKVYTPADFTEETVAEFSHEAALCGALHHPNIVKFFGMCVSPPTICLISELCQGSLDDITYAVAQCATSPRRQQFLINLGYMLDAARAVAYIHSFSPPFLHRDIKPANFLVDFDNTVKLTDFGESRTLARGEPVTEDTIVLNSGAQLQKTIGGMPPIPINEERNLQNLPCMTVKGTVDYMAPEVIKGKAGVATYGEAADIYSLAITMWDILNPREEKFPVFKNNYLQVFEYVVDGKRPPLDPQLHPSLREVIESAWQADPRLRPSAQDIVNVLESIQEEVSAVFALQMYEDLDSDMVPVQRNNFTARTFVGTRCIERMRSLEYVHSVAEGVRLGNALMDAGLVHHSKHCRPFEYSHSVCFFDEENIRLCQPIAILGGDMKSNNEDVGSESDREDQRTPLSPSSRSHRMTGAHRTDDCRSERSDSLSSRSIQPLLENGICGCRRLGQRLEEPKVQFRRKMIKRIIKDENVLTAHLLNEDNQPDDFEGFETIVDVSTD